MWLVIMLPLLFIWCACCHWSTGLLLWCIAVGLLGLQLAGLLIMLLLTVMLCTVAIGGIIIMWVVVPLGDKWAPLLVVLLRLWVKWVVVGWLLILYQWSTLIVIVISMIAIPHRHILLPLLGSHLHKIRQLHILLKSLQLLLLLTLLCSHYILP